MSGRCLASVGLQAVFALGIADAVSAHAQSSIVVIAPDAPPPPRYDTMPSPPTADAEVMTRQVGHRVWDGRNWDWVPGHHVERPAPTAVWERGRWSQECSGGYVWIDGHCRS